MKRNFSWIFIANVCLVVFMLLPIIANCQIGNPDDPAGDPDAPIDGGVCLLIATGVGYGIKRARDSRKKNLQSGKS